MGLFAVALLSLFVMLEHDMNRIIYRLETSVVVRLSTAHVLVVEDETVLLRSAAEPSVGVLVLCAEQRKETGVEYRRESKFYIKKATGKEKTSGTTERSAENELPTNKLADVVLITTLQILDGCRTPLMFIQIETEI